jgi:hypothetical protein
VKAGAKAAVVVLLAQARVAAGCAEKGAAAARCGEKRRGTCARGRADLGVQAVGHGEIGSGSEVGDDGRVPPVIGRDGGGRRERLRDGPTLGRKE